MNLVNSAGTVVSEENFRAMNPLVSFPAVLSAGDVEPYGMSVIQATPQPPQTPFYTLTEVAPVQVDGVWMQAWQQTPIDVLTAKSIVLNTLASARYSAQTRPVTVSGVTVAADTQGLLMLRSAIDSLNGSPTDTVSYKAQSGWAQLNLSQLQALLAAINTQIQAAFANEYAHTQKIGALEDVVALSAYDVTTGW